MRVVEGSDSHKKMSELQSQALQKIVARSTLTALEMAQAGEAIGRIAFSDLAHKEALLMAISSKANVGAASDGRLQNYESLVHMLPQSVWDACADVEGPKVLCRYLVEKLGLFKPTEGTMATLSTVLIMCSEGTEKALRYGKDARNEFLKACKKWYQTELFGQTATEPLLKVLPTSPSALMASHPRVYELAFGSEGPAKCQLSLAEIEMYEAGGWWRMHGKKGGVKASRQEEGRGEGEPNMKDMVQCMMQCMMSLANHNEGPLTLLGRGRGRGAEASSALRSRTLADASPTLEHTPPSRLRFAIANATNSQSPMLPPTEPMLPSTERPDFVSPVASPPQEPVASPPQEPMLPPTEPTLPSTKRHHKAAPLQLEEATSITLTALAKRDDARKQARTRPDRENKGTAPLKRPAAAVGVPTAAKVAKNLAFDVSNLRLDHEGSRSQYLLRSSCGSKAANMSHTSRFLHALDAHMFTCTSYPAASNHCE